MYSDITINSKNRLIRFSHSRRFEIGLRFSKFKPDETLLDFGSSDGYFLKTVKKYYPEIECVGYDPHPYEELKDAKNRRPDILLIDDLAKIEGRMFGCVTCFETLEHFEGAELDNRISEISRFLAPKGKLILSVPIEIGPTALFKYLMRSVSKRKHGGDSFKNAISLTFGHSERVARQPAEGNGYIGSHIGFDHRRLIDRLQAAGYVIERRTISPFPSLGTGLNSQIFMCLSRGDRHA